MLTIHLHNLIFHSFHGMFKEERILGNNFEVNVDVSFPAHEPITKLSQSIDYVALYAIIKEVMDEPTQLLETVVQELERRFHLFDEKIVSIAISIKKLNPPIANFQGTVGISYAKTF
ncbi:MAG: dihydroneopterin aldolase [Ferruginibacter sp.]|nr:dihydroneopterin aldolase [Ferruginibacter sp.]